jgi:16S rRNA (guanine527-N7)-methyltransferase
MNITDDAIRTYLTPYRVELTPRALSLIRQYLNLLRMWNRRIHLTSLIDTGEILQRHFGESLFAIDAAGISGGRLADVGPGGGFPGVPVKLVCPGISLTLIETSIKKATFLAELVRNLSLSDVEIIRERYEAISDLSRTFEFITSRALGGWATFVPWARSHISIRGKLVLWLGVEDAAVVSKIEGLSWGEPVRLPLSKRRVLLIGELR